MATKKPQPPKGNKKGAKSEDKKPVLPPANPLKSPHDRLIDPLFIQCSVVFHKHKFGPDWHKWKDIRQLFEQRLKGHGTIHSVMYPLTSHELKVKTPDFQHAAVITFSSDKALQAINESILKKKIIPFPKQSLPKAKVHLKMSKKDKTAKKNIAEQINDSKCAVIIDDVADGLWIEIYDFQKESLNELVKGTAFAVAAVVPISPKVCYEEICDGANADVDDGKDNKKIHRDIIKIKKDTLKGVNAKNPLPSVEQDVNSQRKAVLDGANERGNPAARDQLPPKPPEQNDNEEQQHESDVKKSTQTKVTDDNKKTKAESLPAKDVEASLKSMTTSGGSSPVSTPSDDRSNPESPVSETTKERDPSPTHTAPRTQLEEIKPGTTSLVTISTSPMTSTTSPTTTTASPTTTATLETTKTASAKTTAASTTTKTAPITTTTAPTKMTSAPTKTTAAPTKTTAAPLMTTTAPIMTTTAPTKTTTAPPKTTTAPPMTSTASTRTTTTGTASTTAPTKTTTAPTKTTTAPTKTTTSSTKTTPAPKMTAAALPKYKQEPMSFQSKQSDFVVHVLIYNITELDVDAIVNAANYHLDHGGGVAKAIADAAGPELKAECKAFIHQHRKLDVMGNTVTTAGRLPCKKVIHAVGPMMRQFKGRHDQCFEAVKATLENIIGRATQEGFRSIAIPAISSGVFGVPPEVVAQKMAEVVTSQANIQSPSLEEIYLVDIGETVISYIQNYMLDQSEFMLLPTFTGLPWLRTESSSPASTSALMADGGFSQFFKTPPSDLDKDENCIICMDELDDPVALNKCGHCFCRECIESAFHHKPVCPVCSKIYGLVEGNQPKGGTMKQTTENKSLPGFKSNNTIIINYSFWDGVQEEDHPNPGQPYHGTRREAYLPDNSEGRKVLALLKKAFKQRLVFTIGRSRTTGKDDTVTWNDIHHKTSRTGGPQRFGYPDPTYLARIQEELAAKGVVDLK